MSVWSLVLAVVLASGAAVGADRIKFEPRVGVPTFAVRAPVLRIKPGDVVETRTLSDPDDYYDRAGGKWPGEVGPFFIEGATPNDTLVVRILRLRPNRDTAVSQLNPAGISALAGDSRTRLLNDPLPARRFVWKLDLARQPGPGRPRRIRIGGSRPPVSPRWSWPGAASRRAPHLLHP